MIDKKKAKAFNAERITKNILCVASDTPATHQVSLAVKSPSLKLNTSPNIQFAQ
jgi:hypothetical protein